MSVFSMLRAARALRAQPPSFSSLSAAENADPSEPTQVEEGVKEYTDTRPCCDYRSVSCFAPGLTPGLLVKLCKFEPVVA